MSKRRKRKKTSTPNIPQATLERARQQASGALSDEQTDAPESDTPAAEVDAAPAQEQAPEAEIQAEAAEDKTTSRTLERATRRSAAKAAKKASAEAAPRRRKSAAETQIERVRNGEETDPEVIADLLTHPTRVVTEEELHQDYGYVLADLRNMGILAAISFALLVALSFFI